MDYIPYAMLTHSPNSILIYKQRASISDNEYCFPMMSGTANDKILC